MNKLPSREEFIKTYEFNADEDMKHWNEDLYRCPVCNGGVKRDYSVVYMSNPPKCRYFCRSCSYSEIF